MHVSGILPIYRKNNLIQIIKTYNSLFNQIFYLNELIVIYDGHVNYDIQKFFNNKKKIKIIKNFKNIGLGLSLRKAVLNCNNNIIIRIDADDLNKPGRFKKLIKTYKNSSDLSVVGSYLLEFHNNRILYKNLPISDFFIKINLNIRNVINHPTVLLNKRSIIRSGNYENCPYFEDYLLWLKIKKNGGKFINLKDLLVNSYVNDDFYLRRFGIKYFKHYKNFLKICYKKKLINIFFIFFLLMFRLIIYLNFNFFKFIYISFSRKLYSSN